MRKYILSFVLVITMLTLVGCSLGKEETGPVVNIYTDRHYETDQALYDLFTEQTGIKVNVIKPKSSDALIQRLVQEGEGTEADLMVVTDAGRLHRAKQEGLLQSIESEVVERNIPSNLQDVDNEWFGLTVRARVIVYSTERVNPSELSTYEDLATDKWAGKVLVRSSGNIYNQSLLASFIHIEGEDAARTWAEGLLANMARPPKGNDRDQAKEVVRGTGDVAIMNTYYVGKLLNSSDPAEVEVGQKIGIFFPNQDTTGTHINISGAGVTKHAKNKENAIKLLEFLTSEQAQKQYAEVNYEYPANSNVEPSELLKSWGDFIPQDINLTKLGEYNSKAVTIFDEIGWE